MRIVSLFFSFPPASNKGTLKCYIKETFILASNFQLQRYLQVLHCSLDSRRYYSYPYLLIFFSQHDNADNKILKKNVYVQVTAGGGT